MIALGDALLKLNADDSELKKKLDNVEKNLNKVGKAMMGFGVALTAALVGATVAAAKFGDEIAKMSKRVGIGTVALSEMRYMAELSGTSLDALETGVKRMQRVLIDASDGSATAMRALDRLNLTIEHLLDLSPEEQFYAIAEAISELPDPTLRAAVAQEVFGRAGTQMLPMLADGAAGIAKMREEAHKYGRIIDEEAAAKSEAFMDSLTRLKEAFGKIVDEIGLALMPLLTTLLEEKIIPLIGKVSVWVKENEDLVRTLLKVGVALIGAGGVLYAISKVIIVVNQLRNALIMMQAFAGPKGWALLAIGAGVAAATIAGISKLGAEKEGVEGESKATRPLWFPKVEDPDDFQWGGRVPGPLGHRVPIIAHGGEEYLGVGNMARSTNLGTTVINLGLLPGDDITLRKLQRLFKDIGGEDARRQSFGQVNQGYFYGRSSA